MASRRTGSRRDGSQSVERRGRGGDRRRPAPKSNSSTGIILLSLGVIVAVLVAIATMGGDSKKKPSPPLDEMESAEMTPEKGSGTAGRSNAGSVSKKTLKPLYTGQVNREPWGRVQACMSEAYHLERLAKAARAKKDEVGFKREIQKALKEFREAQEIFYEWQDEVEALREGLFDRRFKREDSKFARLSKAMRRYFQFEK